MNKRFVGVLIFAFVVASGASLLLYRLLINRPQAAKAAPATEQIVLAMVPNAYQELYETYAEGRMLTRSTDLGKQISKLATKLAGLEEEEAGKKKRFGLFA